jgi:thiol-disulfide isomerase/thioredoxin
MKNLFLVFATVPVFNLVIGLATANFAIGLATAQTAPNNPNHQMIEAKVKDKELFKMVTKKKEFAIPQLRVYDKQGQQVADFSGGFEPDTFKEELDKVLQSPKPDTGKPVLQAELEIITDSKNKKLKELPPADFTIVEYWADWCEPCHEQFDLLQKSLAAHPELAINMLHVQADPTKLPGLKVQKE